jgi:actin-related protein
MLEHVFFEVAEEKPGYRPVAIVEPMGIPPAAREALFAAAFNVLKARWVQMVPAQYLGFVSYGVQRGVIIDFGMQL